MKSKLANILDLEFDGAREVNKIIEIGITVVDLEKLEIVKTVSFPISYGSLEDNYVSEEIHLLTGWTAHKLTKQGEPLGKVVERLKTRYGSKNRLCVVDCNDEFSHFSFENNPFDINPEFINVSTIFKIKSGDFDNNKTLLDMLKFYGLKFEGKQHRASVDSFNIARLFLSELGYLEQ